MHKGEGAAGLSPRVRGNPGGVVKLSGAKRSIPARAGEPARSPWPPGARPVYPRACGGTASVVDVPSIIRGLSPRVRGNRPNIYYCSSGRGSIPARAGEPRGAVQNRANSRVYPRACGGTIANVGIDINKQGLSPRVRGNPKPTPVSNSTLRSIPARAGEPGYVVYRCPRYRVYPRACGGTLELSHEVLTAVGLSPRVRGNPPLCGSSVALARSIPARAGNPALRAGAHSSTRSIPARAGEPYSCQAWEDDTEVYPRACGGTANRSLPAAL